MKRISFFSTLILLASTMVGLAGCDKEEEVLVTTTTEVTTTTGDSTTTGDTIKVPNVEFSFSYWPYVSEGEVLTISEFVIDEENSSSGVTLNSVTYYFDDVLVAMSEASPHALNYTITNESIGEHTLKIVADCDYEGLDGLTYTYRLPIYVLEEPFALSFNVVLDNYVVEFTVNGVVEFYGVLYGSVVLSNGIVLDSRGYVYQNGVLIDYLYHLYNGVTLSGHVELSEDNTIEGTISEVSYYWDDVLFAASAIDPFRFSYLLEEEADGTHILSSAAIIETEYSTFTVTCYTPIIVNSDDTDDSTLAPICVSSEQVGYIQVDMNGVTQTETEFIEVVYYSE